MKEFIEYNYNIDIDNLIDQNEIYSFIFNNDNYMFVPCSRSESDLNDIILICQELTKKNVSVSNLIYTKDNKLIVNIDEKFFVLIRVLNSYKEIIDITNMIELNKKTLLNDESKKNYKNLWSEFWAKKIDYFEYQTSELALGKNIILNSFSYYIGLAENAISYVNKVNSSDFYVDRVVLSHRRVYIPNLSLNYYNPLSFIFDLEVRDVAEYIKSLFYSDEDAFLELVTYLKCVKLTGYSYHMLFARILYPSQYFDIYEKVILNEISEDELIKVIKKTDEFEKFLNKVYYLISNYYNIDKIEWISDL